MKKRSAKLSKSASKRLTWNVSSNVSSERRINVPKIREHNKDNAKRRSARPKRRRTSKSRLLRKPGERLKRQSAKKRMRRKSWLSSRKERQRLLKHRPMVKLKLLQMLASSKKLHRERPCPSKIIRSRREKARKKNKRVRERVSLLKRHLSTLELLKKANKRLKAKMEARARKRTENLRRMRNNSKKSPLTKVLKRSTKSSKRSNLQMSSSLLLKKLQLNSKNLRWRRPSQKATSKKRGSPLGNLRNLRMPRPHRLAVALRQRLD